MELDPGQLLYHLLIPLGLGLVAAVLGLLSRRATVLTHDGHPVVRSSILSLLAATGAFSLTLILLGLLATLDDHTHPANFALLIASFCSAAAALALGNHALRFRLELRDNGLLLHPSLGTARLTPWPDIASVTFAPLTHALTIHTTPASHLPPTRLITLANPGTYDLLEHLRTHLPPDRINAPAIYAQLQLPIPTASIAMRPLFGSY